MTKNDNQRHTAMVGTLVAAGIIIAATQAYAGPIRFDNPPQGDPGHYEWPTTIGDETHWLDVTQPAASQPAAPDDPIALKQQKTSSDSRVRGAPGGAEVEWGGLWGMFLTDVGEGTPIPSGLSWNQYGYIYYTGGYWELPAGQPAFIGMRFDPGDGLHYGWVGVVRDPDGTDPYALDAFAWGYETEVGMPIAAGAPEPSTLAALTVGAVAVLGRRRRRPAE